MAKFSVSMLSDAESLSLSRYNGEPDAVSSSLQHFDLGTRTAAKRWNHMAHVAAHESNTVHQAPSHAPPLSTPFGHEAEPHELHHMFARAEYAPSTPSLLWSLITVVATGLGVALGVLLSRAHAHPSIVAWIQLPGQLYLDALQCVIVPATFCMVVVATAEVVGNRTVRRIACMSALWFALTALLAAAIGTLVAWLFSSAFAHSSVVETATPVPQMTLQCASSQWLTMDPASGAVFCGPGSNATNANTLFTVSESDVYFAHSTTEFAKVSMTDQVVGVLSNMIPVNVITGFVDGTYVSVVFTAFVFAVACAKGHDTREGVPNYVILLITQAEVLLRMLVNALVGLLPVAVISIVAGAIATAKPMSTTSMTGVVYLGLALVVSAVVFLFVVMALALFLTTHCNLFRFFRHLLPAQAFALGSASNIATLPTTVQCIDSTGDVPRALNRIVVALGATCNLTGMSLYAPLAVVFLAQSSGLSAQLTAAKYVQLWLLSAVAGFGAKTVPNAEMVMVLTIERAIVGNDAASGLVATLMVADWLLQRVRTVVNVTCHAIVARIVAERCRTPPRQ
jgi:Na+/H+-dicarboxylate symporter